MAAQKTPAIVIRTQDYGEADRIITFLSPRAGRLTLLAPHARKSKRRFLNSLEPLSLVNLQYREKPLRDLGRVEGCELVEPYAELRRDLLRLGAAACLAEVAGELVGTQEGVREVFGALHQGLHLLERGLPPEAGLCTFLVRLVNLAGYGPRWERCDRCGKVPVAGLWFDAARGGIVCEGCRGQPGGRLYPLSAGAWKLIRLAQEEPRERLARLRFPSGAAHQTLALLQGFIRSLTGRELKSFIFWDKVKPQR